jgi:hypothetical protein
MIIDSPYISNRKLVRITSDIARGVRLVKSLGGRNCADGWHMTPDKARKWELLFCAGYDTVSRYKGGRTLRYVAPNSRQNLTLYEAVRRAETLD